MPDKEMTIQTLKGGTFLPVVNHTLGECVKAIHEHCQDHAAKAASVKLTVSIEIGYHFHKDVKSPFWFVKCDKAVKVPKEPSEVRAAYFDSSGKFMIDASPPALPPDKQLPLFDDATIAAQFDAVEPEVRHVRVGNMRVDTETGEAGMVNPE